MDSFCEVVKDEIMLQKLSVIKPSNKISKKGKIYHTLSQLPHIAPIFNKTSLIVIHSYAAVLVVFLGNVSPSIQN